MPVIVVSPGAFRQPKRQTPIESGSRRASSSAALRGVECDQRWDKPTARWHVYFTCDEPPEPVSPDCSKRELWSSPGSVDTGSLGRSCGVVDSFVFGW